MEKIALVIEKSSVGEIWGRVNYNNNLIVDHAPNLKSLENQMKSLLEDFEDLNPNEIEFEIQYDISELFKKYDYLNVSIVADKANIARGLMRQYTTGKKSPSRDRLLIIENTIHKLADELRSSKLSLDKKAV